MNHSPLKTALAYECFQDQDNSTLALPSDQKMKTGTSGRQHVQEQVMMTVKRQKSKSSQSSTLSHSNRGKGARRPRDVRPSPCALVCRWGLSVSLPRRGLRGMTTAQLSGRCHMVYWPASCEPAAGVRTRCGSGWVAHWGTRLGVSPPCGSGARAAGQGG